MLLMIGEQAPCLAVSTLKSSNHASCINQYSAIVKSQSRNVDVWYCTADEWHVPHGCTTQRCTEPPRIICIRNQIYIQHTVSMATMLRCPAMRAVTSTGRQVMCSHTWSDIMCLRFLHIKFEGIEAVVLLS